MEQVDTEQALAVWRPHLGACQVAGGVPEPTIELDEDSAVTFHRSSAVILRGV